MFNMSGGSADKSTNPGSVWFPEVSQTRRTAAEFPGQTARNSNFPPRLPAPFHFTADKQRVGLVAFCCSGAASQRTGRAEWPTCMSNIDSGDPRPPVTLVCDLLISAEKENTGESSSSPDHSPSSRHVASPCWYPPLEGSLSSQGPSGCPGGDPEQTVIRPQPQQQTEWICSTAVSAEPQWLLCFPDSLSQGKIPYGLSQEKTHFSSAVLGFRDRALISVESLKCKNVFLRGVQTL